MLVLQVREATLDSPFLLAGLLGAEPRLGNLKKELGHSFSIGETRNSEKHRKWVS